MLARLRAVLPPNWFSGSTPVLDALLSGPAAVLAAGYSLIRAAAAQTRLLTASGGFLDLIALDFFGSAVTRRSQEGDQSFGLRLRTLLFADRATRRGVSGVLASLTGHVPMIFEPARPADTGAYATPTLGYGMAGGYGSLSMPGEVLMIVQRPAGGIADLAGYGCSAGGYGQGTIAWGNMVQAHTIASDEDIYAAVTAIRPAGTICWVLLR